jgi:hypothetical protein
MRTACRLVIAVLLVCCARTAAHAQESGPTMTVEAGWDGYCRLGTWCPIRVVLANEGPDVEAELRVHVPRAMVGNWADVYAQSVVLPTHSRKAVVITVPWTQSAPLQVTLVSGHQVLARSEVSLRSVSERPEEDLLVAVVSSAPSALSFLSDLAPAGGQAVVAHVSLEHLPGNPLAWEALDLLVLNDVDTAPLRPDQLRALQTWLSLGGHLVVGGGAGAGRTAAGLADLLPVTVGEVRTVSELEPLGELVGGTVAPGPYPVTATELREGEVVVAQDGLTLIARRGIGAGTVSFLAFDAGLNPFARWEHNSALWSTLTARQNPRLLLAVRDRYSAETAAATIPSLSAPSATHVVCFLLAYTVLIGPLNYLVLRRTRRPELGWVTIPALVLGFTLLAYAVGAQTRGREAIINRLALVIVPEGSPVGRATELIGLFSPRRTQYDVHVDQGGIRRLPDETFFGQPRGAPRHVLQGTDAWIMDDLAVDVGGVESFIVDTYLAVDAPQAELQIEIDELDHVRLAGTIRNGAIPLRDAVLIVGRSEYPLGDLAAGQVISQIGPPSLVPEFGLDLAAGGVPMSGDVDRFRRMLFLGAVFPTGTQSLQSGIYLLGWSDALPESTVSLDTAWSSSELTLLVFGLATIPTQTGETLVVPPVLITSDVEEVYGEVLVIDGRLEIHPGASAVVRFDVLPSAMVDRVDRLILELESGYVGSGPPAVSFWDWTAENWQPIELSWGRNVIPEPARFVRGDGTVRVLLGSSADGLVVVEGMTITIEGQR